MTNDSSKTCVECGLTKPITEFVRDSSKPDGYRNKCKECRNVYLRNRYKNKREDIREYLRNWSSKNPDKIKKYSRISYLRRIEKLGLEEIRRESREQYNKHREKRRKEMRDLYRRNAEARRAYARRYAKLNPDKNRMRASNKRKAVIIARPPWYSNEHDYQIKLMFKLSKKLQEETGIRYNVDHIHPLCHKDFCGLHVPWNLQVIPESENFSKSNHFIPELGLTAC